MSLQIIVNKLRRYALGIAGLRKDDIILVSYPKSGNTWVRFFLCNLITRVEGDGDQVDFKRVDATMPQLAVNDLTLPWPYRVIPRIVKTHNPFWFPFLGKRAIYVIRDPRDVMVSHYHFVTGKALAKWEGSFADFIRHPKYGLENWFRHVQSWQGRWHYLCYYERLLADDVSEFRAILQAIGSTVSEEILLETVAASRFDNVKKIVEERGHTVEDEWKPNHGFMRKGQSRDWVTWFDEQDLALYAELQVKYNLGFYEDGPNPS
jgi:hypothetical protein